MLLGQSRTWICLNDPRRGAVYHASPPGEGETVVLVADTSFDALIRGRVTVEELAELGVVRVYGEERKRQSSRLPPPRHARYERKARTFLGDRDEGHLVPVEDVDELSEVAERAREPVDL